MSPAPTALDGLRVVELSGERSAFAGKLLADMGADVVLVEPPGGDPMRGYEPFADDVRDPDRSLFFWHYNTSKRGIALDLEQERGAELFRQLAARADLVIESEPPGRLAELGLDAPQLRRDHPELIWVSITPFGREDPRSAEPCLDLTVLAGGGPVWNNGYDDHALPPVRGGGNQGYHTACHFAVMSALVALLHRDAGGPGQLVDVSMHAAANVTTEAGSYEWLVAERTVERQTGRHATSGGLTMPSQMRCADGRYVNTGVPPRRGEEFARMRRWIEDAGLLEEFPEAFLLDMGAEREQIDMFAIGEDEELQAIFGAGREALNLLASKLSAFEFFRQGQERGFPAGVIYAPEEAFEDPHFRERGIAVPVEHEELGREVLYPGAPYAFEKTPWRIARRAPRLGEHTREVLAELGLPPEEAEALARAAI